MHVFTKFPLGKRPAHVASPASCPERNTDAVSPAEVMALKVQVQYWNSQ